MPQIKKPAVEASIVQSAFHVFREKGYSETRMLDIARRANTGTPSVYVYFKSKFHLLFAVYQDWLEERLDQLEHEIAPIRTPWERLHRILMGLWLEIPAASNGFANNLMQALADTGSAKYYDPGMLERTKARVAKLIVPCATRHSKQQLDEQTVSHLIMMAFDGFVLSQHLNGTSKHTEVTARLMCNLLLPNGANRSAQAANESRAARVSNRRRAEVRV